jgi:hypothetical protein
MIDSLLKKIGIKKNVNSLEVISRKKISLYELLKNSNITKENLEIVIKNGNDDENILRSLKNIFKVNKKITENSFILQIENFLNIYDAFKVAKMTSKYMFVVSESNLNLSKYTLKSNIFAKSININEVESLKNIENTIIVCDSIEISKKLMASTNLKIFNFINDLNKINTEENQILGGIGADNIGDVINYVLKDNFFYAFSCGKSIFEIFTYSSKVLRNHLVGQTKSKSYKNISETELMSKMQGGSKGIDFHDMLFALRKVEEIGLSSIASVIGFKITPEMQKVIKQQKSIIEAMTYKEKTDHLLIKNNAQRISRIAKGSGVSEEMVRKLVDTIEYMKNNSGSFASMMSNPSAMMNMMNKIKK